MAEISIRPAARADVPRLTEIYNYYVIHTAVTFDLEPYTIEKRYTWFEQFSATGRHRLLVAEENGFVLGYCGTTFFRVKAAYDTTVETTIYCDQKAIGKRIGSRLYEALFDALKNEDVNRLVAGYTLPNDASAALHARCGFRPVGIYTEVGRKFGRFWDVAWYARAIPAATTREFPH